MLCVDSVHEPLTGGEVMGRGVLAEFPGHEVGSNAAGRRSLLPTEAQNEFGSWSGFER